ncbi:hypothetical protein POM88_035571 [Heracleum sosnowskyi]|uniref:Uncharacterized protein n=1 Tax=Heracleum sosnowskyi TaxID=360622 RepID=A0AAD8HNA3_9APIA|nr:hypothetical protein POM88_035571 [Heracleum sosnowskyi]
MFGQLLSIVHEKLPEVIKNPPHIYYKVSSDRSVTKFDVLKVDGTTKAKTETIMLVIKQLLNAQIDKDRVLALKSLHKTIAKRDKRLSSQIKQWIADANAKLNNVGGSCRYDDSLDDEDEDIGGSGSSGGTQKRLLE